MNNAAFNRLLELAKAKKAAREASNPSNLAISPGGDSKKNININETISNIQERLRTSKTEEIDLTSLGLKKEPKTPEEIQEAVDVLREVFSPASPPLLEKGKGEASAELPNLSAPKVEKKRRIILNPKQQEARDRIISGENLALIGAAGTGKTTIQREVTETLVAEKLIPLLKTGTKHLQAELPGVAILSYTRKAVNNIRHAVVDILKPHTMTIHKILEFAPEFFEIEDPQNPGNWKKSMRFIPTRNRFNPLPPELQLLIHEESSMESVELYEQLMDAIPHKVQEVFIGDIQQLPPIFGMAILGFKLLELPIVELNEVYRQAAKSPIISLAWEVLKGNASSFSSKIVREAKGRLRVPAFEALSKSVFDEETGKHIGTVKIQPWQKKLSSDLALLTTIKQFTAWEKDGYYRPEKDIILIPFNKAFGTIELNIGISNYLGKKRGAVVHEVIAGFQTHYLAVGDRVMYDKEDAVITAIRTNGNYLGKAPKLPSEHMDRTGQLFLTKEQEEARMRQEVSADAASFSLEAVENFLEDAANSVEDRVQAASHVISVQYTHPDADDEEIALDSAADVNNLLGGYAITVHKFQGSQEKKVFLIFHQSHAVMLQRELLYTGATRAEEYLHVICEPDSLEKAVKSQRIKGNTIQEKAEFFKGKGNVTQLQKAAAELAQISAAHSTSSSHIFNTKREVVEDKDRGGNSGGNGSSESDSFSLPWSSIPKILSPSVRKDAELAGKEEKKKEEKGEDKLQKLLAMAKMRKQAKG